MSLSISKLENVRTRANKTTARCPACAEAGGDRTGDHLVIQANGRFGCVVYPGDSAEVIEHRKRIFALCGDRSLKPLAVHPPVLGRLNQSQSAERPLKTGLLGRLGRAFESRFERERTQGENASADLHYRSDFEKGVLSVLSDPTPTPHRPLSKHERAVVIEWCGTDNHPFILEARNLFNATIVEIVPTAAFSPAKRRG